MPNYLDENYAARVLGVPGPAPSAEQTRNDLLMRISSMAGGPGKPVTFEELQALPTYATFARLAQEAGLDPAELVNSRNTNISNYNSRSFTQRFNDSLEGWFAPAVIGTAAFGAGNALFGGGASGPAGSTAGGTTASGIPASATVTPTALTSATPVVTGTGLTTAGALAGSSGAAATGAAAAGLAPAALGGGGTAGTVAPAVGGAVGNALTGSNTGAQAGMDILDWLNLGGGILGGYLDYQAAGDAADAEAAAYQAAIDEQRRQFDLTRSDLAPYMESGVNALGRLDRAATGDMSGFTLSPDYNFVRSEGTRGVGNTFAAAGGSMSGNALRALSQYNTGLASREYGNWWERNARQAGIGGAATNTAANVGQSTAGNVGNALIGAGSSRASGVLGQNQGISNTLGNVLDAWTYRRNSPVWQY